MEIKDLRDRLHPDVIQALERRRIAELTPPQKLAVDYGLLLGKNFVIASPTASGKTLIAELAMMRAVLTMGRKAIYVAPMRALVSEKYAEFKELYPGLRIAMSIGDLDALDQWLEQYDIIFVSTEKLDSLIRHGANWLESLGCIVFDEVHMLDDSGRGPTLEILITRMRRVCRDAQIIALSATIGNVNEIAEWMGAELVESDYRPVRLKRGIEINGILYYEDGDEKIMESDSKLAELRIIDDTLGMKKQILIFYSTKRNAESGAEKAGEAVYVRLTDGEKARLHAIANEVLDVLGKPTSQCERLARCIAKGTAFHHSGLVNQQRHIVEEAFRKGEIKTICSTSTLGLGVNLPAHTVLVRDTTRYDEQRGTEKMSVNIVTQLFGRAGRPKYDKEGRALLIAKSKAEMEDLYTRYIEGELEPINSKLGILPVLRTHMLAFVATGFLTRQESILDFLGSTFYGYQYSSMRELKEITSEIMDELAKWKFVESSGTQYRPTKIGKRVSELYIDPLSARWMIEAMPRVNDEVSALFMISNTIEMRPYVKISEVAYERFPLYEYMLGSSGSIYEAGEMTFYDPLRPFSTSMMLNEWISEKTEKDITKSYSTTPGAFFTKISNADWLLYSAVELAKLMRVSQGKLIETRVRVRYGVRKELLDLIRLEQVGRVRARAMFDNGIKSVADLRKTGSKDTVEKLFGKEISKRILEQIDRREA